MSQSREAHTQMLRLVNSIVMLVIVTTGLVHWLSIEYGWVTPEGIQALVFDQALYYTVVTLSTLGYGDYAPVGTAGRIVMTCLITIFMIFVPYQSARFFELRRLVSSYRGAYTEHKEHIIICCDATCASVRFRRGGGAMRRACAWMALVHHGSPHAQHWGANSSLADCSCARASAHHWLPH